MTVLWWCYDDVMVMLWWWCYDDVMMMLWWCYGDDAMMMVLWLCYDDDVMMMLRRFYDHGAMTMLWRCHDDAMMMLSYTPFFSSSSVSYGPNDLLTWIFFPWRGVKLPLHGGFISQNETIKTTPSSSPQRNKGVLARATPNHRQKKGPQRDKRDLPIVPFSVSKGMFGQWSND